MYSANQHVWTSEVGIIEIGLSAYRVVGCPLFGGCLSIEVNGRTVRIVCYIVGVRWLGVSVKQDPLYFGVQISEDLDNDFLLQPFQGSHDKHTYTHHGD